jgi:hypothetical protein
VNGKAETDWAGYLQSALSLGISPTEFWALSLREWRMLAASDAHISMQRSDLAELIASFPDMEPKHGE